MTPAIPVVFAVAVLTATIALATAALAQSVEIKHAVARVVIIPENRTDVGVEVVQSQSGLPALSVVRQGRDVVIDGGLNNRRPGRGQSSVLSQCRPGSPDARQPGEGAKVSVRGLGQIDLADAPLIVLRTPRRVDVNSRGAVFGSIGPGAQSLDLGTAGCGHWQAANVAGEAAVSVAGSGTVRMGSSVGLTTNIGGSGHVIARSTENLQVNIGGSGDVRLHRVDGPIKVSVGGSGDVEIDAGRSPSVDISIAGSGDVRFDGTAHSLSVAVVGSGDVYIKEVTGPISRSVMGSSKVHIGR